MSIRPVTARVRQRGITLLESLVSILILAIAVLGLLGVQLRTQAETQTGVRRAQAVRLIEDFAERIKSNPDGFARVESGSYDSGWNAAPPTSPDCSATPCDSSQLAASDLAKWKEAVKGTLPLGQARIFASADETGSTGNRRQLGVIVGWRANERELVANDTQYTAAMSSQVDAPTGINCPTGLVCHLAYVQP